MSSCLLFFSQFYLGYYVLTYFFFFVFFFLGLVAYGSSQAKGQIGAAAASLRHSHSEHRIRPTLQLSATLDP